MFIVEDFDFRDSRSVRCYKHNVLNCLNNQCKYCKLEKCNRMLNLSFNWYKNIAEYHVTN